MLGKYRRFGLSFVLSIQTATLSAQALPDAAARFGARDNIQNASLSPDGHYLAVISPMDGPGTGIFVADLTKAGAFTFNNILKADGKPNQLRECSWASATRLVCKAYAVVQVSADKLGSVTRLFAIDASGDNPKQFDASYQYGGNVIDWKTGKDGHVLIQRWHSGDSSPTNRSARIDREGLGLDDFDTVTLTSKQVETPTLSANDYITDGRGQPRILALGKSKNADYDTDIVRYMYRKPASAKWEELVPESSDLTLFRPVAIDPDQNIAYGLKKVAGRFQAWSKALDGTGTEALVLAHPDVDVDGFVRFGRDQRVVGVTFATDKRQVQYFDPKIAALATALAKALPKFPQLEIIDADDSQDHLLIFASSDVDPGHYYLFDKTTRSLDQVALARPDLSDMTLPPVKSVSYPAADGTIVPAYLTLPASGTGKGLPTIVMPHGGPESRDEWGFDWLVSFFANQGYAVLQPQYRGSAGFGDQWLKGNGYKNWREAISDVDDGGRWLLNQGIADPARLFIVGWSYGGYAALQSQVLAPDLFKKIVAIAPVTDLEQLKNDSVGFTNFYLQRDRIGTGPHLEEGSPARHAGAFKAPVLLFHGSKDINVKVEHSRVMNRRLQSLGKASAYVEYPDLTHSIDDGEVRANMLRRIDSFLQGTTDR